VTWSRPFDIMTIAPNIHRWGIPILAMVLLAQAEAVTNQTANQTNDGSLPADPYLKYQPAFARSLPIQILITGISVTLSSVLMLNLLFTAQYHWPISRLNFCLQFSGIASMMCIFVTTFHVILSTASSRSKQWPYMLDYLAVDVPPTDWSDASIAWWYGLVALATGFVHITHIQFLAMLYPSNLEAKLILALMGPLVLVSAITELLPMHKSGTSTKLTDLSDAIQSICNSTLSLLYTIALLVWGVIVNQKQAWRLEGGTAAFGAAALLLAMNSTALSFLQLSDIGPFAWMTSLLHTSIVWQNFVSWWWWVGAGMSETYEDNYKARDRKRQAKNRMKTQKGTKGKGALQTFDRLWRRGTRDGTVLPDVKDENIENIEDEALSVTANTTSVETASRSSRERTVQRRQYRNATPSERSSSPAHKHQNPVEDEESHLDSSNSGWLGVSGWWHTLRRAHRNAVRAQNLERVVINSRRQRHRQEYYESPYTNETRALEALEEMDRERIEREVRGRRRKEMGVSASMGSRALWWGPFERWRFRDRTVY